MSFLDHLRPKWKHSDPAVRESAVRALKDQEALERIADDDPVESVRLAAVQTLTDQDALAKFANGPTPLAVPAAERLTDPKLLMQVALRAETRAAREVAVDRIEDGVLLHRISVCDTDAWVRLKARLKTMEPDHTREFIRHALSRLQITAATETEFSGSLDEICRALLRDRRFRINGGVDDNEIQGATIHEFSRPLQDATRPAAAVASSPKSCAQFVAFKRGETGEALEVTQAKSYFEIQVWRTGENTFVGRALEKHLHSTLSGAPKVAERVGTAGALPTRDSSSAYATA